MKNCTTAQRLKQIMDMKQLRQVDVLDATEPFCRKYNIKLGKNALSQYVSGKVEPGQERLTILGMALGVSEAWLMGYDVPMERNETPTSEIEGGRTKELMELFGLLTAEQQSLMINAVKGILSEK